MIKKVYVVLIVLIFLVLVRLVLVSNNQNSSGSSAIVAPSGTPGRAKDCSAESVDLYNRNDRKISSLQVDGGQISWQKDKYTWMVFKCPDESQSYTNVFMLTNKDNNVLLTMEDERFDKVEIKDMNRDRLGELVVSHGNSGNCRNCQVQSIFQLVNGAVKDLLPDMPKLDGAEYANVWTQDVNSDGVLDILQTDDSFENHEGFFHYNAPTHVSVLTWKDGKYQSGGSMFSKYYLGEISKRDKARKELLANKDTLLSDVVALAVENYWDYKEIGKNDEGYANFILQTNVDSLPKTISLKDSDKIWLLGIRNEIEQEYKDARSTIMPLY